mgnify:CR=1 FL=1
MRAHNFIPILICCLIIILLYFTLSNSSNKNEELSDLKLELINDEVLDLSEFQGRPYIIRFFASWCAACKEDGPKLKELSRKMNAPIIGVAVGDSKEKIERLPNEQLPYDYIYIDESNRVKNLLKNRMLPETIIIDVEGNVALRHVGSL